MNERSPGATAKRAAVVADQIVEDVMAQGWPVGDVLGSEAELLGQYGVSRAILREAVRLLEHQQVATTRRGPGGGLVVTEPTVDAVIGAVVLYLHRADATLDEVFEARIVLERISVELATGRLDDNMKARLRAFSDGSVDQRSEPRALHTLVAQATGNAALQLFVEVLNRVAFLYSPEWNALGPRVADDTARAHARIAEAVLGGDTTRAVKRMTTHLEAEAAYLRGRRSTRQFLPDAVVLVDPDAAKRAEEVARRITVDVVGDGLEPGDLIGTEGELMEREKVSRAVLREAVRLLEHHQIAAMRRGPGGGLFVAPPNGSAVADIAAIYLARRAMRLAELAELRTAVEAAIAELASARIDDDGADRLRDAVVVETTASDADLVPAIHGLHAAVASAAGNRVLELVALVLIRLTRLRQVERLARPARREIQAEVLRAHRGIAAAVEAGDAAAARRRMQRHLEALGAVMRSGER